MVVKSKIGRKRYIIFKINANLVISKNDLIYTLNSMLNNAKIVKLKSTESNSMPAAVIHSKNGNNALSKQNSKIMLQPPWVINLQNNLGLIRCHHLDKEKTISLLHSIKFLGKAKNPATIQTMGTTGTIRSARKKYLDKLNTYPLNNPNTYQK